MKDIYAWIDWAYSANVPPAEDPPDPKDDAAQQRHMLSADRVRLVLILLVRYANDDGEAWPSTGTIAQQVGLSWTGDARRALRALVAGGLIKDTGRREKRVVVWLVLAPRAAETATRGAVRASDDDQTRGVVRASDARTYARTNARTAVQDVRLSRGLTRGLVRDEVEVIEVEGEGARARDPSTPVFQSEPPSHCPDHPQGTTAPCRACGDARVANQAWTKATDAARADYQRDVVLAGPCEHGILGGHVMSPATGRMTCGWCADPSLVPALDDQQARPAVQQSARPVVAPEKRRLLPPCPHGQRAGAWPADDTGRLLCPQCDTAAAPTPVPERTAP